MDTLPTNHRPFILEVRRAFLRGDITLDEAKERLRPVLEDMNKRGEKIAKEFGKKFRKFTFGYIFR